MLALSCVLFISGITISLLFKNVVLSSASTVLLDFILSLFLSCLVNIFLSVSGTQRHTLYT